MDVCPSAYSNDRIGSGFDDEVYQPDIDEEYIDNEFIEEYEEEVQTVNEGVQQHISSKQSFTVKTPTIENQTQADPAAYEYRELTFLLETDLNKINSNPESAVMKIADHVEYGLFEETPNPRKTKENAKHYIAGMWLTSVDNGFDSTFALNSVGVGVPTHVRCSDSGVKGCYIIKAKEKFDGQMIALMDASKVKTESPLLKKYPERNLDNLDDGIQYLKDGKALIDEDHPVLEYFNKQRIDKGLPPLSKEDQNDLFLGQFIANGSQTRKCHQDLKANWEKCCKPNNLYKLGFSIKRAFLSKPANSVTIDSKSEGRSNGISKHMIANNGSKERVTRSIQVRTPKEAQNHDPREIFHGVIADEARKFVLEDQRKLYVTVLVKYKVQ